MNTRPAVSPPCPTTSNFPPGKETITAMTSRNGPRVSRWLAFGLTCLVLVALLAGCDRNNPSGPADGAGATTTSGGVALYGLVVDADTQQPIPVTTIVAEVYMGNVLKSSQPLANSSFVFNGLDQGVYTLVVRDTASPAAYRSTFLLIETTGKNTINQNVTLSKVPSGSGSTPLARTSFTGVLKSSLNNQNILFGQVRIGSYETMTLSDGSFLIPNLTQGTYEVVFSKSASFEDKRSLAYDGVAVMFGNLTISDQAAASTRTQEAVRLGVSSGILKPTDQVYDLGVVTVTPKVVDYGKLFGFVHDRSNIGKGNFFFRIFFRRDQANTSEVFPRDSVTTDPNGYFVLDGLEEGYYYAVGEDAQVVTQLVSDNIVYTIAGTQYKGPIKVTPGLSSEMSFEVGGQVPSNAPTAVTLLQNNVVTNTVGISGELNVRWTFPTTNPTETFTLRISTLVDQQIIKLVKTMTFPRSANNQYETSFNIGAEGLRNGYYICQIGNNGNFSKGVALTVRPASTEMQPVNGSKIDRTVSNIIVFSGPVDANATAYILNLYNTKNELIYSSTNPNTAINPQTFILNTAGLGLPPGDYIWEIRYTYFNMVINSERTALTLLN